MRGIRIASFDVFDTCLTRRVIAPGEVFRLVARALRPGGFSVSWEEDFIAARMEAERRARRRASEKDTEEITLEQIWDELGRMLGEDAPPHGSELELRVETETMTPVAATRDRVVHARSSGQRIIFVSDTYLPVSFVSSLLMQHGLFQPGDGLYVSSQSLKTKATGALFQHVLLTEKAEPADVLHFGDHLVSDQMAPARLGLKTEPCHSAGLERVERLLLEGRRGGDVTLLETAGELRACRVGRSSPHGAATRLVRDFLGPFLCLFGHWVLQEARRRGLKRLYFAARDTRLLHAVVRRLQVGESSPIECHYLFVSRQALLLPASNPEAPETFSWLRRDFESATLADLARQLEVSPSLLLSAWHATISAPMKPEDRLSAECDWHTLWGALSHPPLADALKANISKRRIGCLAYFKEQGLFPGEPFGFVDLGWYLTCQEALTRLLAAGGASTPLCGLYLGLKQGRRGSAEAGPSTAIFRWSAADLPHDREIRALDFRETLIEHIVGMADHPTVLGYASDGSPLFAGGDDGGNENPAFSALLGELEAYAGGDGKSWENISRREENLRQVLSLLIGDFFTRPGPEALTFLAPVNSSPLQGDVSGAPLARPYLFGETAQRVAGVWFSGQGWSPPPSAWPEAARLLSSGAVRSLMALGSFGARLRHRLLR